jgi:hypothetical protein
MRGVCWVNPLSREAYAQAERDHDRPKQLKASIALSPWDAGQAEYLMDRLLEAEAQEVVVIRGALLPHKAELSEGLWTFLLRCDRWINGTCEEGRRRIESKEE